MQTGLFITGTGTNVGKTFVSALLLAAALTHELDWHYFKPIQTGEDCDCREVKRLAAVEDARIIQPLFRFALPQSPNRAAAAEKKSIDVASIKNYWQQLTKGPCLVEGAGGLIVPLTDQLTIRDLIKTLQLPLIIVATSQLGTINHTLLTVEAAQQAAIPIKGVILVGPQDPGLAEILQQFSGQPILAEIPWLSPLPPSEFRKTAASIFSKNLLQRILL